MVNNISQIAIGKITSMASLTVKCAGFMVTVGAELYVLRSHGHWNKGILAYDKEADAYILGEWARTNPRGDFNAFLPFYRLNVGDKIKVKFGPDDTFAEI